MAQSLKRPHRGPTADPGDIATTTLQTTDRSSRVTAAEFPIASSRPVAAVSAKSVKRSRGDDKSTA